MLHFLHVMVVVAQKKCFDKLQDVLKDNTILGTIDFVDSEDETEKREKVKQWISSIKVFK